MSLRRVLAVFRRDLAHNLRRSLFWVWVLVLILMAWAFSAGAATIQSGDSSVGGVKAHVTSEFAITSQIVMLTTLIYGFFVAVAAGMAVIHDDECQVSDPRIDRALMLIDPAGFRWLNETWLKVDRGVKFYNTAAVPLDGLIVANRAIVLGLGLGAVALCQRHLTAALRGTARRAERAWTTGDSAPELLEAAPSSRPMATLGMSTRVPGLFRGSWAVARAELTELRSSAGLYLFIPLLIMESLGPTLLAVGPFDTPLLQTSGTFAVRTLAPLSVMLCLLLMFYTVESLWRERRTGLASISLATPIRTGSLLLGKVLANGLIAAAVVVVEFAVAAGFLWYQGKVGLELWPFVLVWGLLIVPTLWAWMAFVMATLAATRSRYTTYAVSLAALIVTGYRVLDEKVSWVDNWPLLGAIDWSDISVLEFDRPALWLNRVLVVGLAVLLTALTARFYSRRDADAAAQAQRLRPRPLAIGLLQLLPLALVPLAAGAILWVKVDNGFQGEATKLLEKDYWRKNLATYRDWPLPDITAVEKEYSNDFFEGQTDCIFGSRMPFRTRIKITGPADFTWNSVGTIASDVVKDGLRTTLWASDQPVNIFNIVGGRWAVRRGEGTAVYYHPAHVFNVAAIVEALDASRKYYSAWFRPFPWRELKLSEFPAVATYAMGFPTNIPFSEKVGFLTRSDPKVDLAFMVTAHEAAHQWWGNMVAPGKGPGAQPLGEGASNFSTLLLFEQVKGLHARIAFARKLEDEYAKQRQADSERPLVKTDGLRDGDQTVSYDKTAWVLWMLLNQMGREPMLEGIQAFFEIYHANPDHPVLQDFLRVLRSFAADPEAFDAFTHQWFYEVVVPEYHLTDVARTKDGAGWKVTARLENSGTGVMPVEVAAVSGERFKSDGSPEAAYREVRATVSPLAGDSKAVTIRCEFDPTQLVVDPDARVLQLQRKEALFKF